ncbi:hypothetical protein LPJ56_001832 [Coemansia sp. RSA 2599]|nr:hypothetical protein LPJ75_001457 [Coemansia sp. RSA 2598]KAJ1827124.1 hypothetical protein LPJ56_001832 [Coemansia sp. RSA 2599]
MKVDILVRSPSIPTKDGFAVVLDAEQTVKELKQAIEREHPSSPRARNMRVIWRGRLLKDTMQLSSMRLEEDADGEQPEIIHSVVHFVTDVAANVQSMAGNGKSQGKRKEDAEVYAEAGGHAGGVNVGQCQAAPHSLPTPSVVPLGSMFQYVLIDGAPYVAERRALPSAYESTRPGLFQPGQQAGSTGLDMHEFNARMLAQYRAAQNQQNQHQRQWESRAGQIDQRNLGGDNPNNINAHHPLADVFRNLTFGNIWSVIWVLLRLLLFVVVFAHDASWERMFLLSMLVAGVLVLRSQWVQQRLAWLRQHDQRMRAAGRADGAPTGREQQGVNGDWPPEEFEQARRQQQQQQQPPREYSALEKARALVIALFTSLIPAEPFHVPAPAED